MEWKHHLQVLNYLWSSRFWRSKERKNLKMIIEQIISFQVRNVCEFIFEGRGKLFSSVGAKSRQINLRGNGGSWSTIEKKCEFVYFLYLSICVCVFIYFFLSKRWLKVQKIMRLGFPWARLFPMVSEEKSKISQQSPPDQHKTLTLFRTLVKRGHIALIIGDNFGGVFVTAL